MRYAQIRWMRLFSGFPPLLPLETRLISVWHPFATGDIAGAGGRISGQTSGRDRHPAGISRCQGAAPRGGASANECTGTLAESAPQVSVAKPHIATRPQLATGNMYHVPIIHNSGSQTTLCRHQRAACEATSNAEGTTSPIVPGANAFIRILEGAPSVREELARARSSDCPRGARVVACLPRIKGGARRTDRVPVLQPLHAAAGARRRFLRRALAPGYPSDFAKGDSDQSCSL